MIDLHGAGHAGRQDHPFRHLIDMDAHRDALGQPHPGEDRNDVGTFVANGANAPGLAFFPTSRLTRDHLYLIEQPYGRVFAFETALPLIDSSSATFT